MRTASRATLLFAVVSLLAVACAGADEVDTAIASVPADAGAPATTGARTTTTAPPAVGGTAPGPAPSGPTTAAAAPAPALLDFTARRLHGGTLTGAALAGRDVVLWMWAPWCPQCNREAAHVAAALAAFGDQVTFVGMAGHDTDDAHRAFVAEHGLDEMLHVVDEDGSLWARFGVSYQPAWVFIDDDGTVSTVAGGLYEDLDARIQALVDG